VRRRTGREVRSAHAPLTVAVPNVLHVDFRLTEGWVLPIRQAAAANPALGAVHRRWRESELSDLALSVETRLGALKEIPIQIAEYLMAVSGALPLSQPRPVQRSGPLQSVSDQPSGPGCPARFSRARGPLACALARFGSSPGRSRR
jgi:hypothetical protein